MIGGTIGRIMATSTSAMEAQTFRIKLGAENLANSESLGYRRKMVNFRNEVNDKGAVRVVPDRIMYSSEPLEGIYDPWHPNANEDGIYFSSNVNMLTEIVDSREAYRSYEANLGMFTQAKRMFDASIDLLRR